jgi:ankyrin repeat protein
MMAFLLDYGIDINEISTFGYRRSKRAGDENGTPLHAAVRSGFEDRISFLLDRGADPNVKTECGDTALDYARRWNFETGIKVLEARLDTKGE